MFFHLPWIEQILYVYYWNILCLCVFQFLKMLRNDQHFQFYLFYVLVYRTYICMPYVYYICTIYQIKSQLFRKSPGNHFRIGWTASIRIPTAPVHFLRGVMTWANVTGGSLNLHWSPLNPVESHHFCRYGWRKWILLPPFWYESFQARHRQPAGLPHPRLQLEVSTDSLVPHA